MDEFMQAAVDEARKGQASGGIPIGAVLVYQGRIMGRGHNRRIQDDSTIHHAEMNCLENAGRLSPAIYQGSILYTTLSPCSMCSGAIRLYKIPRVVIGENQTFKGDEDILKASGVSLTVLDDQMCQKLLQDFIQAYPQVWNEDIGVIGE